MEKIGEILLKEINKKIEMKGIKRQIKINMDDLVDLRDRKEKQIEKNDMIEKMQVGRQEQK